MPLVFPGCRMLKEILLSALAGTRGVCGRRLVVERALISAAGSPTEMDGEQRAGVRAGHARASLNAESFNSLLSCCFFVPRG